MKELFLISEILDYIERKNIKSLNEFIDVVCIKDQWFDVVCEYSDFFVDYFKKINNFKIF